MLISFLILIVVILDQITKYLATFHLSDGLEISFIPYVLSFRYHENKGAAWGMFSDQRWVFMSVSTIAIIAIIAYLIYTKKEKRPICLTLSLSFFCGGGIGNMIDRIFHGYVVDFLRFDFIDFPIFNVADSFICIGAGLMVLYLVLDLIQEIRQKKVKTERESNPNE